VSRFRFRLEPVLEHRERQEELAQQELAQSIAAVARQQEAVVAAERAVEAELEELRHLQTGGALPLHELRQQHEALDRARQMLAHEVASLEALEGVAIDRRSAVIAASQAVEALEKLKERYKTSHVAEVDRRDVALMDELALRTHRAGASARGNAA
jgi:flagellar FliJ protein